MYASAFGIEQRFDGSGLSVLLNQINNIPKGLWTAFEGAWLLVLAAMLILWKRRWWFVAHVGALGLALGSAFAGEDISRSTAYAIPFLFTALSRAVRDIPRKDLEALCLLAFLISMPITYYVGGKSTVWWCYPLPIQLARLLLRRT